MPVFLSIYLPSCLITCPPSCLLYLSLYLSAFDVLLYLSFLTLSLYLSTFLSECLSVYFRFLGICLFNYLPFVLYLLCLPLILSLLFIYCLSIYLPVYFHVVCISLFYRQYVPLPSAFLRWFLPLLTLPISALCLPICLVPIFIPMPIFMFTLLFCFLCQSIPLPTLCLSVLSTYLSVFLSHIPFSLYLYTFSSLYFYVYSSPCFCHSQKAAKNIVLHTHTHKTSANILRGVWGRNTACWRRPDT